jgi:hypothetical protein
VPIWLAGTWSNRKALRRADQHGGVFTVKTGFIEPLEPKEVAEIARSSPSTSV